MWLDLEGPDLAEAQRLLQKLSVLQLGGGMIGNFRRSED